MRIFMGCRLRKAAASRRTPKSEEEEAFAFLGLGKRHYFGDVGQRLAIEGGLGIFDQEGAGSLLA